MGSVALTGAAPASTPRGRGDDLRAAFVAVRARLGLVVLLVALAALAWWSTADRMAGMDAGPGTDVGALGWFLGIWVVMMAAMMLPSLAPTVALYATMTRARGFARPALFTAAYLVVWGLAGLTAYGLFVLGRSLVGSDLRWAGAGRWVAAGVLVVAAVYELTPLKDACLSKCRSPLGFLLGGWRDSELGAVTMGARNGAWCLGCCWALMATLFALGVMSLAWMAVIAALIALEKTLPWRRAVTWGAASILLALAVGVLAAPHSVPGLTVPSGSHHAMGGAMGATGSMGASGSMGAMH